MGRSNRRSGGRESARRSSAIALWPKPNRGQTTELLQPYSGRRCRAESLLDELASTVSKRTLILEVMAIGSLYLQNAIRSSAARTVGLERMLTFGFRYDAEGARAVGSPNGAP